MNEKDILGKHFEFVKNFFENPLHCGYLDLYQLGDICCECGFEVPQHRQLCHEISYIVSGSGDFYVNGVKTSVKEGDIFVCSHGQEHFIVASEAAPLRYLYVGFLFNDSSADESLIHLKSFYDNVEIPLSVDHVDMIMPFLRIVDELYGKAEYFAEMIQSYLKQIVLLTYRTFQKEDIPNYVPQKSINAVGFTVYSVIRYIDKNIFELKDIRSISENLGYSYSYLSHLFKDKTGMTLQKYISYKKIEKALELLKYGNFSVTQVAMRLNYETVQSFSKAFKRTMSFSPNEYVKKQVQKSKTH